MTDHREEKRRAYLSAKTRERAYVERYYPVAALGARPAEVVTPDVLLEFDRLSAVTETARLAWKTPTI